jgi:tetratricopeptide (TPR) repeat protein
MSDEMLKEAIGAVKAGQRLRAKDLLTRLIKVDQGHAEYWLWMSAVVDTEKEQVYCLQNALKADPNSVAARRGLVVLGALRPEEANLPPAHELEDLPVTLPSLGPGGGLGVLTRRRNLERLAIGGASLLAVVVVATVVMAMFKLGPFAPKPNFVVVTSTPRPTNPPPTAAVTTLPDGACTLPAEPDPATPLAVYLCLTQTPTAVPVPTSSFLEEDYKSIKTAYLNGEWNRILERAGSATADEDLAQSAEVYFYIAEAYRHTANLDEALANYRTALQKNAGFAPALWGRARVEIEQNKLPAAQDDLAAALTADPAFAPAYLDRAALAGLNGDWAAAVSDLEAARSAAPNNALVKANLALAYAMLGDTDKTNAAVEAALATDPGQALAYFARGLVLQVQGSGAEAEPDMSRTYRYLLAMDRPQPERWQAWVLFETALAKRAADDGDEAIALLTQAMGLDATNAQVVWQRAQVYDEAKNYAAAVADYQSAIALFAQDRSEPVPWGAYLQLGRAYLALGQPAEAAAAFEQVLALEGDRPAANLGLGQALYETGDYEAALAALNEAFPQEGSQPDAYFWRAQVYTALGRTAEAVADLRMYAG